jgi:hypothetical protein
MVESTREIGNKIERETRFYIASLVLVASNDRPPHRDHWAIEAPSKDSMRSKRKVAAWDDDFLASLIAR